MWIGMRDFWSWWLELWLRERRRWKAVYKGGVGKGEENWRGGWKFLEGWGPNMYCGMTQNGDEEVSLLPFRTRLEVFFYWDFFFLRLFLKGAVYGSSKKGPLTLHRNDLNRLSCRVCRIVYIYQKYQFDPVSIDMSKIKFWCKKATTSSVIKALVFCTKIQFLTYLSMRSQAYFFHIHQFANPTRWPVQIVMIWGVCGPPKKVFVRKEL